MSARMCRGLYLRRQTWWFAFRHRGNRHQIRLGRFVGKRVAQLLACAAREKIMLEELQQSVADRQAVFEQKGRSC